MEQNKKPSTFKFVASLATIVAFGGLAIGMTYSLFTSEKKINTHVVVSGNLQAKLYLKELKQDVLNSDGVITTQTVDLSTLKDTDGNNLVPETGKGVDLEKYSGKIFDNVKLVPTMEGSATFYLYNSGDVAFDYTIETSKVAYKADGTSDDKAAVLSQIEWTVNEPESNQVNKGVGAEITVSYKFNNSENNNAAQQQSMDFDILFKLASVKKA